MTCCRPCLTLPLRLPQLEIETFRTEDCTVNYSTGTFTCLAAVFKLKRNPGYLFFSTYIPSVLIVIMSWISFWIPPESTPARVTLGVTSLLTLATQNTQTQQSLPPVSYTKVGPLVTGHMSASLAGHRRLDGHLHHLRLSQSDRVRYRQ